MTSNPDHEVLVLSYRSGCDLPRLHQEANEESLQDTDVLYMATNIFIVVYNGSRTCVYAPDSDPVIAKGKYTLN